MTLRNHKGLLGLRPLLLLALIGAFAGWAAYNGYIKWKGPRPAKVAEEMKEDVKNSVKKLTK